MDKEKEIKSIMRDVECTREEAEEIWVLEQKAKENGAAKVTAKADKKRAAAKREPKIDAAKVELITHLAHSLKAFEVDALEVTNAQREISFEYGGDAYSVTLIKHRPKKDGV